MPEDTNPPEDVFDVCKQQSSNFKFNANGAPIEVEPFAAAKAVRGLTLNPLSDEFDNDLATVRAAFKLPDGVTIEPAAAIGLVARFVRFLEAETNRLGNEFGVKPKSPGAQA